MTVVISDGRPTAAKSWPLAGARTNNAGSVIGQPRGIDLLGAERGASYVTLYRAQPWVYIVCNKLMRGIGRLPWGGYTQDVEGNEDRDLGGPLDSLLNRPYPRGSGYTVKEFVVGQMAIHGNALLVKWRPGRGAPPAELWPVDWRRIEPIAGTNTPVAAYRYGGDGERIFYPDDVVHFQWYGPEGPGISPLEPLRRTLALEDAAQRYGIANFSNAARPSGALVHPARMRVEQEAALQAKIDSLHAGVDNSFRMLMLSGGMDWKPFGYSAADSQTIETRRLTREEVAAAYDIPPPAIGILDRATFSNVSEQHRMLYQDTYGPWLVNMTDTLDVQLIAGESTFEGQTVRFDLNEMLKGSPQERAAAYAQFRISSVYTANELRRIEGLKRIDDPLADAILLPLNMRAVGDDVEQAPADDVTQVVQAMRTLVAADVLSGNGHSLNGG